MNWKKIGWILIGLALIAIVIYKLKSNKGIAEDRLVRYDNEKVIGIHSDTVEMENMLTEESFVGTFEAFKESKISAEQQGKINRIFVDVGSHVKKAQELVQLDNSLLKLQLQSVEVQIEGLEKDVNRYGILAKAGAVQAVQLEKAELALKSAKVQKSSLLEQIAKTTIKAAFEGIITAKFNEEGAFAAPGVPLLQLTDISSLKFTVNVAESDLNLFNQEQEYSISVDVLPEIRMKGDLLMIGSKANMGNSYTVQFLIKNNPALKIKSGMFGKLIVNNEQASKAILIPASAIIASSGQDQVYIVKNGAVHLQNIMISKRTQNKAVISNGLKEGDVIVTSGFVNLYEGAKVNVN